MLKGHGAPSTGVVGNVGDYFEDLDSGKIYKLAAIVLKEKQMGFVTIPEYVCETNQYVWVPVAGEGGGCDLPLGETTTVKEVLAETDFDRHMELDEAIGLVSGETYVVNWNGQEYEVTASDTGSSVELSVDNKLTIADMNEAIASEMGYYAVLHCDSVSPNTVSVGIKVTEVKKISGKYVEGMGWAEKSVSGKVVVEETAYRVNNSDFGTLVNPEPLENGYASMPTEFSFESGKTYRITVDGVPYIGTAEYREGYGNFGGGDGVPLVDENGGYHGVFVTAMGAGYSNYFYYDEGPEEGHTGTFIIEEVAEVETIHPIDEKFLPSGIGADFGIVKTPTSDSIVEGTFTVVDGQITDQNWSGIAGENHVSKTYIVTINGELYHAKVVDGQNYSGQGYSGGAVLKVMSVGENSSILAYGECVGAGYAHETVNRAYSMEDGTYEITFQEGTVEIKTIDPLYLPKSGELYQASGETVTASEFNALLNSLADAGYIKLSVGL